MILRNRHVVYLARLAQTKPRTITALSRDGFTSGRTQDGLQGHRVSDFNYLMGRPKLSICKISLLSRAISLNKRAASLAAGSRSHLACCYVADL